MEALIQQANATPRGQKKSYSSIEAMPKGYHPRFVEAATCVFLTLKACFRAFHSWLDSKAHRLSIA